MKVLIAYASKHGTTKNCAEILKEKLSMAVDVDLVNFKNDNLPSPDEYDVIVLGSSVRMGSIHRNMKKYIKHHMEKLMAKNCAIFLCCGFPDEFEEYLSRALPKGFTPSYGSYCFGGELKPQKVKGIERLIVKYIRQSIIEYDFEDANYKGMLPEIIPEHINLLADKILNK